MNPEHLAALACFADLEQPWSRVRNELLGKRAEWEAERTRADAWETEILEGVPASSRLPPLNFCGSSRADFERHNGDESASGKAVQCAQVAPLGASLLESKCISDPVRPPPTRSTAVKLPPGTWLAGLERATAPFRLAKSKAHRVSAAATLKARAAAGTDPAARAKGRTTAEWHTCRAKGALERFARVVDCGRDTVVASCITGCGVERRALAGCGCGRVCVACRARAARERQARFAEARGSAIGWAVKKQLFRRLRPGGRWSEKLLTLTVPHVTFTDRWCFDFYRETMKEHLERGGSEEHGEAYVRIALLLRAWRGFSIRLQKWARAARIAHGSRVRWYRAFEWTPGADALGHPHFHVYLLSPFLPVDLVREWWTESLRAVVGALPPVLNESTGHRVMVDIKEVRQSPSEIRREIIKGNGHALKCFGTGGQDVVRYADGWTIAEHEHTDMGRVKAPLEVLARVYEALDAKRLVQAARNFLPPVLHVCPFCSGKGTTIVHLERGGVRDPDACAAGRPRAPP